MFFSTEDIGLYWIQQQNHITPVCTVCFFCQCPQHCSWHIQAAVLGAATKETPCIHETTLMKMHKWHLRIHYLRSWQQSCWDSSLLALCQWRSGCWLFRTPGTAHTITASHPRRPALSAFWGEKGQGEETEIHSSEPDTRVCHKMMHLHSEDAHLWCASAVPAEIMVLKVVCVNTCLYKTD